MENFNILNEKEIVICAHQGSYSGNIPGNSIVAFDIAIRQGAQMIELDVTKSADGELFVFHPEMERRILKRDIDIRTMSAEKIKNFRVFNGGGGLTNEPIQLLDDVFEHLKGKCYINVDKFADNPCEIMEKVKKHNMVEQIIVKCDPIESILEKIEQTASEVQYLTIINDKYDPFKVHADLMKRTINYVGLEVVFSDDSAPNVSDKFIDTVHSDGKLIWGNAILFDSRYLLAGLHSDDTALGGNPDLGWGWFVDKGFDIIQTDWTRELKMYLKSKAKLHYESVDAN